MYMCTWFHFKSLQLKQWADQQIEEARNRKEAERAGDKEYAAYIQAVDGARTALEVDDANRSVLEVRLYMSGIALPVVFKYKCAKCRCRK